MSIIKLIIVQIIFNQTIFDMILYCTSHPGPGEECKNVSHKELIITTHIQIPGTLPITIPVSLHLNILLYSNVHSH